MAIEKRKINGETIAENEKYQGTTLDWDTVLGGPIVHVPPEFQPDTKTAATAAPEPLKPELLKAAKK